MEEIYLDNKPEEESEIEKKTEDQEIVETNQNNTTSESDDEAMICSSSSFDQTSSYGNDATTSSIEEISPNRHVTLPEPSQTYPTEFYPDEQQYMLNNQPFYPSPSIIAPHHHNFYYPTHF